MVLKEDKDIEQYLDYIIEKIKSIKPILDKDLELKLLFQHTYQILIDNVYNKGIFINTNNYKEKEEIYDELADFELLINKIKDNSEKQS